MAFDVRRTQPKLNRRESWVQTTDKHLAEGNSIYDLGQAPETKIRRRPSVAWSA